MGCSGLFDAIRRQEEFERLQKEKSKLKTEKECLEKVREIRDFLRKYGKNDLGVVSE